MLAGMELKTLEARIDRILQAQDADGAARLSDPSYPPQVGQAIQYAAHLARSAIGHPSDSTDAVSFLRGAVERIQALHQRWRQEEEDEDGFGSATLHEVRRDLESLLRESE
jgi:hypothetical protein